jgi:hypothetical protein
MPITAPTVQKATTLSDTTDGNPNPGILMKRHTLSLLTLLSLTLLRAEEPINLIPNADFSEHHPRNTAHSMKWSALGYSGEEQNTITRITEGDVVYQRIVCGAERNHFGIDPKEWIQLSPEWKTLEFGMVFRLPELTPGKDSWNRFLVKATYFNDFDKEVGYEIKLKQDEPVKEWKQVSTEFTIPDNATQMRLEILFLAANGEAHIRSVGLRPKGGLQ